MLLLFLLWTLWATRRVVHKSTGLVIGLCEVDRADAVGAKVDGEDAILPGRAQSDHLALQALADAPGAVLEADEAVAADLADLVVEAVLDRRQNLGKRPRARLVALRRRRHAERLVRALMIVGWRQSSKARWQSARSRKLRPLTASALKVRWKRSSLPWVWG